MNSGLGNKKKKAASHPKPTKSQVRTELHYYPVTFFWLVDDFKMVFKELIYMDFRHYLLANVTDFSENGSDSMKKRSKYDSFALIDSVLRIKKQLYR